MATSVDTRSFKYDYYSGANIGLWAGDQLLISALGVEFSLSQLKRPIYGYASSLYDGVASGTIQVAGMLYFNFTQAQLLPSIVNRASGGGSSSDRSLTIDRALNEDDFFVDLNTKENLSASQDTVKANQLKDQFWGSNSTRAAESNLDINGSIGVQYGRPDQHLKGFDILVTYGFPFGSESNLDSEGQVNATLRVLRDVRITGFGQTLSVDGNPVIERYSFIARSVT